VLHAKKEVIGMKLLDLGSISKKTMGRTAAPFGEASIPPYIWRF
jgi:hypothetical protein